MWVISQLFLQVSILVLLIRFCWRFCSSPLSISMGDSAGLKRRSHVSPKVFRGLRDISMETKRMISERSTG